MRKETKLIISEILDLAEDRGVIDSFPERMDLSDEAYGEARTDFKKTKVTR